MIAGLSGHGDKSRDEHLRWAGVLLSPGDEVHIRILEGETADPPQSSKPVEQEDEQRKYYEWARRFYLANREKYEPGS